MTEIEFQPLDIAACYGTGFTARAISFGTASFLAGATGLPRRGLAD